jgi:glycogen debranching enzyme
MAAAANGPYGQPLLQDLAVGVAAPTVVLSGAGGDIDARRIGAAAHGIFHADVRVLSLFELTVDDLPPEPLRGAEAGSGRQHFVTLVRHLERDVPDPTVRLDRYRVVSPGRIEERLVLRSSSTRLIRARIQLRLGADLVAMDRVKSGMVGPFAEMWVGDEGALEWSSAQVRVRVHAPDATVVTGNGPAGEPATLTWPVRLGPGERVEVSATVDVDDRGSVVCPAPVHATWARPEVYADDRRLTALLRHSLDDLHSLRMTCLDTPDDVFLAAGSPWFFTLFGRDAIWAARMLLPLGTELARGTLATLARLQGQVTDPGTEEEPGKILHELRRKPFDDGKGLRLPPVYYGTVDATPLWICLLHDAWRWGMADRDVEKLLPAMDAALGWVEATARAGGGFLRYLDHLGHGLANQGWKDSGDSVRFADGTQAQAPMALAEVQGYAHEAAVAAAALLDSFGRPGADRWRAFAADLATRFRQRFWVEDAVGRYPAMALDGQDRPADAVASNMGHLLTSGLLDDAEVALVAARLAAPDLSSGYGLRTMSRAAVGYGALRYHCGTVWAHDTVIAITGLLRRGQVEAAAGLIEGFLAASAGFAARVPELWSGDARDEIGLPVPYPAACRPQAWSAASSIHLLAALLGLQPDAVTGTLSLSPVSPSPVGALQVRGLTVGPHLVDVAVDAQGSVQTH